MQSIKTETLLRHGCFTSVRAWQAEKAGREKYAHTLFTNWIFLVTFSSSEDLAKIYIPSTIKTQKGAAQLIYQGRFKMGWLVPLKPKSMQYP